MMRSRSALRKNLRRLKSHDQPEEPTPELSLLRRLRFTADRLAKTKRSSEVASDALALAALFSGIGRGLVVRRARTGHFVVGARRDFSACTDAERRTLEGAARAVLTGGKPIFDLDPRDGRARLLALPLFHEGVMHGALVLHGPGRAAPFDAGDRATLLGLAQQAALALSRLMAAQASPTVLRARLA